MDKDMLIESLHTLRQETLRRASGLAPEHLNDPHPWRGVSLPLQFHLAWLAEGDEGRRVRIVQTLGELGQTLSVGQQAAVLCGHSRGALLGALAGVPEALFEREPAEGEWSPRRVLGHVIAVDRRYLIAVQYALSRAQAGGNGPLRPPDASLPAREGLAESGGTVEELLASLRATHTDVLEAMARVPDALLDAPTNWVVLDVDVRFRLHRFAAHDREHAIQIRKAAQALGIVQTEPQLLLADAQAARGALEALLRCVPDERFGVTPGTGLSIAALAQVSLSDEQELLTSLA